MSPNTDFSNMTLEELTPIVSMRPGKEYTREELRAARAAFLSILGMAGEAPSPEEEVRPPEAECAKEIAEEITEEITEEVAEEITEEVAEEVAAEMADAIASSAEGPAPREEQFILRAESRLARFLYRLYAYLLVPLLALEALVFLLGSVATAVFVPDIPFLFLPIFCAVFYTMFVTVAWHQFLHRSRFGLLLNRSLIVACVFRGVFLLRSPGDFLPGVIFVAVSSLFLIFFVGYDNTFILPSPKKSRGR